LLASKPSFLTKSAMSIGRLTTIPIHRLLYLISSRFKKAKKHAQLSVRQYSPTYKFSQAQL